MKTKLLIEQHIHGAFGINFNKCTIEELLFVSKELLKYGIGGFYPTIVTDSVENITRQIDIIKNASKNLTKDCADILGIHLEGIFINPLKKGIHNPKYFMPLAIKNYKKIEDNFIKIITLAPELDKDLLDYLKEKNIKVQAGHCIGDNLSKCTGVTHLFNAMEPVTHRKNSTSLSALIDDNIYTEVIADGVHLNDDILRLIFKTKPNNKILLISDALPITYSNLKQTIFADEKIFYDGIKASSKEGIIAGSTTLTDKIVKILAQKNMFSNQFINNIYEYHNLEIDGELIWNDDYEIISVRKGKYHAK